MLGLGGIQVFSRLSVIVYNYEKVRELIPSDVFGHIPNTERQDWFKCIHLPFAFGFYMLYLYILVDSIWSFKIVIYFVAIILA